MGRRPVPPIAWLLTAGTGVALVVITIPLLHAHGTAWFFREGDAYLYRATALDPFGTGKSFVAVGRTLEIPYRYGRIGLPFASWLLSAGRPRLVPWWLIVIHLAAIAAIPGLAAALLDSYGAPALGGAVALASPGLLLIHDYVYAEPLLIALVLFGFNLEARNRPRAALGVLAYAVLVKEIAALALIPLVWRALRRRDLWSAAAGASALVPYAAWSVWLRFRVGEFPFHNHTVSEAFGWPGVGIHQALAQGTPDHVVVLSMVFSTIVLCAVGAYVARQVPIGGLSAMLAIVTGCLGLNALVFESETMRLLTVPQVFALLCLVMALAPKTREAKV
jgi:hypothetical protein